MRSHGVFVRTVEAEFVRFESGGLYLHFPFRRGLVEGLGRDGFPIDHEGDFPRLDGRVFVFVSRQSVHRRHAQRAESKPREELRQPSGACSGHSAFCRLAQKWLCETFPSWRVPQRTDGSLTLNASHCHRSPCELRDAGLLVVFLSDSQSSLGWRFRGFGS